MSGKKIGVIYGGNSAEREISLNTGAAIACALKKIRYDVVLLDAGRKDFIKKLMASKIDIAFIALHGRLGEDGTIQGLFEFLGIPYTGSGVLASALAMNKIFTKRILDSYGIKTPKWQVVSSNFQLPTSNFPLPVVVKPAKQGSAIGVSIVKKKAGLKKAINAALKYDNEVIVEQYIPGKEITVAILDDAPLTPIEIVPKNSFYDFYSKYAKGGSVHIIPPNLKKEIIEEAKDTGLAVHNALGCKSFSRVDMIVDRKGDIYVLEVNTIPGMTGTSLFPDAAKYDGFEFTGMLQKIIESSLNEKI